MEIINPASGEVVASVKVDTRQSLAEKFGTLRTAQPGWQGIDLIDRMEVLNVFSGLLQKETESLSATLTSEVGKPLQQSRNEIKGACSRIKWLTANAEKYLVDEVMTSEPHLTEKIVYEPLGVVCNISAWNYPYLVGVNVFVPALLAGNTVLYKPSEYASLTGMQIERLLKEAGVPDNAFHTGIGGSEAGGWLLELPFDGYFFTGSYKTGKSIFERVSAKMVPCQCEMGGKDPLYVCDDVHSIRDTARATADGAFYNNGQSCCSVERIYVHEKIYEGYVEEFVKEVNSWKMGIPTEEGVYIGPLTRRAQLDFLEGQIGDALAKGAIVATGGHRARGEGYFFEPTVLLNVTHEMEVMREESFGPVIGIMRVRSDEEAIRLMRDTSYGLTASVFSGSQERAEKVLQAIDAGTGYWNCCDRVSAALPWSGRRHSGFGVTLSHAGLRAFTRPKAYHLRN